MLNPESQIICALNEWSTGRFVDLSDLVDGSVLQYGELEKIITGIVTRFKEVRKDVWLSFSSKIFLAPEPTPTQGLATITMAISALQFHTCDL
jgi:hypothetical protein